MLRSGMRPPKEFTLTITGLAPKLAALSNAGWKPAQHMQIAMAGHQCRRACHASPTSITIHRKLQTLL